jgi:hypothetical protein
MEPWIIYVAIWTAVAVLGALITTYFSIRNVEGARERAFVIKASVLLWVTLGLYCAVVSFLPSPYPMFLFPIFLVFWTGGERKLRKMQAKIREEDAQAGVTAAAADLDG